MVYALASDILARVTFDNFGNPYDPNWCIFVHFFDYFAWASVYMHLSLVIGMPVKTPSIVDSNRKLIWFISLAMSCYFSIQAFVQLTYINSSLKDYNLGMFQEGYEVSHTLAIIIGVSVFAYFKFIKKKVEKYRWV